MLQAPRSDDANDTDQTGTDMNEGDTKGDDMDTGSGISIDKFHALDKVSMANKQSIC